jgi:hypothetical protein
MRIAGDAFWTQATDEIVAGIERLARGVRAGPNLQSWISLMLAVRSWPQK